MNLMNQTVQTNIGAIPLIDFLDIYAAQNGFDSIEDMLDKGYRVPGYTHITPGSIKRKE